MLGKSFPDFLDTFLETYDAELVAGAITAAILFVNWLFQARTKLVYGLEHGFTHAVPTGTEENPNQTTSVHTRSYLLKNIGRKAATNVEVVFNFKPDGFAIWPEVDYDTETNPQGAYIVKIESLAP